MDSRELYNVTQYLTSIINWDNDWIHFGTGDQININLVDELFNNFLSGDRINFVFERTNSETLNRSEILPKIKNLLGKQNFQLWNEPLNRAIQFKNIGVLQKGAR